MTAHRSYALWYSNFDARQEQDTTEGHDHGRVADQWFGMGVADGAPAIVPDQVKADLLTRSLFCPSNRLPS